MHPAGVAVGNQVRLRRRPGFIGPFEAAGYCQGVPTLVHAQTCAEPQWQAEALISDAQFPGLAFCLVDLTRFYTLDPDDPC